MPRAVRNFKVGDTVKPRKGRISSDGHRLKEYPELKVLDIGTDSWSGNEYMLAHPPHLNPHSSRIRIFTNAFELKDVSDVYEVW